MINKNDRNYSVMKRRNQKCFCGCNDVIDQNGIYDGYCRECLNKREEFVLSVVGDLSLEQSDVVDALLNTIESIRKNTFREHFNRMVDEYFKTQKKDSFNEPYQDDRFLKKIYEEKHIILDNFINSMPLSLQFSIKTKYDDNSIEKYDNYLSSLYQMVDDDCYKLGEVNARLQGCSYVKKI